MEGLLVGIQRRRPDWYRHRQHGNVRTNDASEQRSVYTQLTPTIIPPRPIY